MSGANARSRGRPRLFDEEAVLDRRYLAGRMEALSALIEEAGPGIDGIHAFLERVRSNIISGGHREGCLLVNSASELHGTAPGFQNFGAEYRAALRERIRKLIQQAEPEDAPNGVLTDQRTDLFVTFMAGLNVTVRGGADEHEIGRTIDAMHATVDTWRA